MSNLEQLSEKCNNVATIFTEQKPSYTVGYWEAVYTIEYPPFKELLNTKCKYLISQDKTLDKLMIDPIGNEVQIKKNLDVQKKLSDQITVCNNFLNGVEMLQQSYISTTTNMYDAWKQKEADYQRQIRELKRNLSVLREMISK